MSSAAAAAFLWTYAEAHPHRKRRMFGSVDAAFDERAVVRCSTFRVLAELDALGDEPLAIPAAMDAPLEETVRELVVPFLEALEGAELASSAAVLRDIHARLAAAAYAAPAHLAAAVRFIHAMAFYGTAATFADVFGTDGPWMEARVRDYAGGDELPSVVASRCAVVHRLELCAATQDVRFPELRSLDAMTRLTKFVVPIVGLYPGRAEGAMQWALQLMLETSPEDAGPWLGEHLHELDDDAMARHSRGLLDAGALDRRFDQLARLERLGVDLDASHTARLLFYAAYAADRDEAGLAIAASAVRAATPTAVSLAPLCAILGSCCFHPAWSALLPACRALVVEAMRQAAHGDVQKAAQLLVRSRVCVRCLPHGCSCATVGVFGALCRLVTAGGLAGFCTRLRAVDTMRVRALIALADDVAASDDAALDPFALSAPAESRRAITRVLVG
jgi:hypothetical protein